VGGRPFAAAGYLAAGVLAVRGFAGFAALAVRAVTFAARAPPFAGVPGGVGGPPYLAMKA
jgi:hypothetical protein